MAAAPFEGRLYWLVTRRDGEIARIDAAGHPAPLSAADLAGAAERIGADAGIAEQGMIKGEDAYYFQRGDPLALPVYRMILKDEDSTRYYLDPVTRIGAAACRRQRAMASLAVRRPAPDRFHLLDAGASDMGHHRPVPDGGRTGAHRYRLLPRASSRLRRHRPCRPHGIETDGPRFTATMLKRDTGDA